MIELVWVHSYDLRVNDWSGRAEVHSLSDEGILVVLDGSCPYVTHVVVVVSLERAIIRAVYPIPVPVFVSAWSRQEACGVWTGVSNGSTIDDRWKNVCLWRRI